MEIPLNVEVRCSDGAGGKSTVIIVDPAAQQITHMVVASKGIELLVPIDAITASAPDHIQLRWSLAELAQAQPFDKTVYVGDAPPGLIGEGYAGPALVIPTGIGEGYMSEAVELGYIQEEQIPENELAIHRGAHVEASDGRVGRVDTFVVDPATGQITHLVLQQGHLWGKREVTVPLEAIDRIQEDIVFLRLDKAAIDQLPHLPVQGK
jgi:sporulation protein YlmC with PRC-barrel domain